MPDASISLGLNANEMYRDLKNAESRFNSGMDSMGRSTGRLTSASDRLWNSHNRVTNQTQGFARSLLYANSTADVLASGLDRLENSMKLSLGAGIGLAVGAVLVERIGAAIAKARQLREAIAEIGKGTSAGQFDSLSAIDARLASITARMKELKAEHAEALQHLKAGGPAVQRAVDATNAKYGREQAGLEKQRTLNQELVTGKARRANEIETIRQTKGDFAANREELFDKQTEEGAAARASGNASLEIETGRKLVLALEALEKTLNAGKLSRTGMTLDELAKTPSDWLNSNGISAAQFQQGQMARQVQELEAKAEQHRINFEPGKAAETMSQADKIRNGIGNLQEGEKNLKDEINASELPGLLRIIAEKVSFKRGG